MFNLRKEAVAEFVEGTQVGTETVNIAKTLNEYIRSHAQEAIRDFLEPLLKFSECVNCPGGFEYTFKQGGKVSFLFPDPDGDHFNLKDLQILNIRFTNLSLYPDKDFVIRPVLNHDIIDTDLPDKLKKPHKMIRFQILETLRDPEISGEFLTEVFEGKSFSSVEDVLRVLFTIAY